MKKLYFVLGIIILAGLFYLGYRAYYKDNEGANSADFGKLEEVLNATTTAAVKPEIKEIKDEGNLVFYVGQDLADIGNSSFMNKVPKEQVDKYKAELARLKEVLESDPTNVENWMSVANIKNFFNNYEGARDAWEYAKYLNNDNSAVYYNLGNLYGGYLKDYKLAEENFLKAIELEKKNVNYYIGTADFYWNFYTGKKGEAGNILEEGMKEMPDDISLLSYAAGYYKNTGNKERALALYNKVLSLDSGNEEVKGEVERLMAN